MADTNPYLDFTFEQFLKDIGRKDFKTHLNTLKKVTREIVVDKVPDSRLAKIMTENNYPSFADVPVRYSNDPQIIAEVFRADTGVLKAAGSTNPATKLEAIRNLTEESSKRRQLISGWGVFSAGVGKGDVAKGKGGLRAKYKAGTGLGIRKAMMRIATELGNNPTLQKHRPNATPEQIGYEALLEFAIKDTQGPRDTDFSYMTVKGLEYDDNMATFKTKVAGATEVTPRILYDETKALIKGHLGDGADDILSNSKKRFIFWDDIRNEDKRLKYATAVQKAFNKILPQEVPQAETRSGEKNFTSSYQRKRTTSRLEYVGGSQKPIAEVPLEIEKDAVYGRDVQPKDGQQRLQTGTYAGTVTKASKNILEAGHEVVAGGVLTQGFRDFKEYAKFYGLKVVGDLPDTIYDPETIISSSAYKQEYHDFRTNGIPVTDANGKLSRVPYQTYIDLHKDNFVKSTADVTKVPVNITTSDPSPEVKRAVSEKETTETLFGMDVEAETTRKYNQIDDMLSDIYPELDGDYKKRVIKQTKATIAPNTLKSWLVEAAKIDDAVEVLENTDKSAEFWRDLYTDGVIDERQLAFAEENQFLPKLKDAEVPGNPSLFGTASKTAIDKAKVPGQGISSKTQTNLAQDLQGHFGREVPTVGPAPDVNAPAAVKTWKDYLHKSAHDYNPDETPTQTMQRLKKLGGAGAKGVAAYLATKATQAAISPAAAVASTVYDIADFTLMPSTTQGDPEAASSEELLKNLQQGKTLTGGDLDSGMEKRGMERELGSRIESQKSGVEREAMIGGAREKSARLFSPTKEQLTQQIEEPSFLGNIQKKKLEEARTEFEQQSFIQEFRGLLPPNRPN